MQAKSSCWMEDNEPLKLLRMPFTEQPGRRVQSYNGRIRSDVTEVSLPIAETTIVAGAKYLVQAKELVQERYSDVVNVVYGDTDSVFVKTVENLSVADAIKYLFEMDLVNDRLGEKISKEVSDEFPDPVFLEFEKVMFPSMLVNRKVQFYSSIF